MNAHAAESRGAEEDFAALLEATFVGGGDLEGAVVMGQVVGYYGEDVLLDAGLKSEGAIGRDEFIRHDGRVPDKGEEFKVLVERYEDSTGMTRLSRTRAKQEEVRDMLKRACDSGETVTGRIAQRSKAGYKVDFDGVRAFLPQSLLDIRNVGDARPYLGTSQPFKVIEFDDARNNIVVSRKKVIEEETKGERDSFFRSVNEGDVLEGTVKKVKDYGAFVELRPGIDGLLHVSDMSWGRVDHPSSVLSENETVTVKVIRVNADEERIGLGLKQLQADPWQGASAKYPTGGKFEGRVTRIEPYGFFVALEEGVEGLVHNSEISWGKTPSHPGDVVAQTQLVEVVVLDVQEADRRLLLSRKRAQSNPWEEVQRKFAPGDILEGEVVNKTEFGMFVRVADNVDGLVHVSDMSWTEKASEVMGRYEIGDRIEVKLTNISPEKERLELSLKQLESAPPTSTEDEDDGDYGALGQALRGAIGREG